MSSVTAPGPQARSTKHEPTEATRSTSHRLTSSKNGWLAKRENPKRSLSGEEVWTSRSGFESLTTQPPVGSCLAAALLLACDRPGLPHRQGNVDRIPEVSPHHRSHGVGDRGGEERRLAG